jgi:hypothetical protein
VEDEIEEREEERGRVGEWGNIFLLASTTDN